MQRYVDDVLALPTVRRQWPEVAPLRVRARRAATAAHYENRDGAGVIAVPDVGTADWAMRELVVLHEIAHHLCDAATGARFAVRRDAVHFGRAGHGARSRARTAGGLRERRRALADARPSRRRTCRCRRGRLRSGMRPRYERGNRSRRDHSSTGFLLRWTSLHLSRWVEHCLIYTPGGYTARTINAVAAAVGAGLGSTHEPKSHARRR